MSGKIFIEDVEVIMEERPPVVKHGEHIIKGNKYILQTTIKEEFRSTIHNYNNHEKILVSKLRMFGEEYYKIVFCNDKLSKAWVLIELSCFLEIKVRRLGEDMFFIVGENKTDRNILSQVSFCRTKPSTKVEEFTSSFTKLNYISFIKDTIFISSTDICASEDRVHSIVSSYNFDGKLLQTHYERIEEKGKTKEKGSKEYQDEQKMEKIEVEGI